MAESERRDTPEQAEFRAYCRDWVAANHPGEPSVRLPTSALEIMTREQMDYLQSWQKAAYDAGLVGCDYPEAVGGGGRSRSRGRRRGAPAQTEQRSHEGSA